MESKRQQKEEDFYRKLRNQIARYFEDTDHRKQAWAEIALLAPDFFYLLLKLTQDARVPLAQKAKLGGAIVYFISPIDLLPEAILGPIGYLDDIAFAAFALHSVLNHVDPDVVREHWLGQGDVLETIQSTVDQAHRFLGRGVWDKLMRRFKRTG
jgi:uncharacterized membrane protein YkvA (DUF1232 family)